MTDSRSSTGSPELRGKIADILADEINVSEATLSAAGGVAMIDYGQAIERLAGILSIAQDAVDCGADSCNIVLARREEAGKAGAEPVERTSSELNHSPSGNLVPSRDSERKQQEPALKPGADKSEKDASPRSADELLTNASGLRAIHSRIERIIARHMGECMAPEDCAREIVGILGIAYAVPETYTEICMNEKCPRGGQPVEIVRAPSLSSTNCEAPHGS